MLVDPPALLDPVVLAALVVLALGVACLALVCAVVAAARAGRPVDPMHPDGVCQADQRLGEVYTERDELVEANSALRSEVTELLATLAQTRETQRRSVALVKDYRARAGELLRRNDELRAVIARPWYWHAAADAHSTAARLLESVREWMDRGEWPAWRWRRTTNSPEPVHTDRQWQELDELVNR